MAKSSRASSVKNNNQQLKKNVFGPVESARTERLSAKLLEIAAQAKTSRPENEKEMEDVETTSTDQKTAPTVTEEETMDIDSGAKAVKRKLTLGRKGIEKRRRSKKSSIVFPKYKDRQAAKKMK
ncbi:hypothetical protein QBC33DRAFT_568247 [Phialemonium atrogriseum]|uniref:DUF2423 domain-containing protein n=1 Tax=Phialemonium atrogriseum TaxID=1093897 RepID=A0AAJ0C5W7_9PEZI|nr:uncharacterized protein QBC33DRAFT_568247 [Phialemonium atrogriseum]KAK1769294.1 hypothetical protein QBC33DRAFT_568247 [Phialemonium atrogriseum]